MGKIPETKKLLINRVQTHLLDNIGRLEGSNPKANTKFLIQACDYK